MTEAERLPEHEHLAENRRHEGQLWNFVDGLLAKGIILRYTNKQERVFFL